jgi:hypothetical protein
VAVLSLSLPMVNSPAGMRRMETLLSSAKSFEFGVDVIIDEGVIDACDGETILGLAQAIKKTNKARRYLFTLGT